MGTKKEFSLAHDIENESLERQNVGSSLLKELEGVFSNYSDLQYRLNENSADEIKLLLEEMLEGENKYVEVNDEVVKITILSYIRKRIDNIVDNTDRAMYPREIFSKEEIEYIMSLPRKYLDAIVPELEKKQKRYARLYRGNSGTKRDFSRRNAYETLLKAYSKKNEKYKLDIYNY